MRRNEALFGLLLGLAASSCFDPDQSDADDTGSGGETSPTTTDSTAAAETTDPDTADPTSTGGCMGGVFGASRFGDACFQ